MSFVPVPHSRQKRALAKRWKQPTGSGFSEHQRRGNLKQSYTVAKNTIESRHRCVPASCESGLSKLAAIVAEPKLMTANQVTAEQLSDVVRRPELPGPRIVAIHVLGYPSHPMGRRDVEAKALELLSPVFGTTGARPFISKCGYADRLVKAAELHQSLP